jgi:hypothetical protein
MIGPRDAQKRRRTSSFAGPPSVMSVNCGVGPRDAPQYAAASASPVEEATGPRAAREIGSFLCSGAQAMRYRMPRTARPTGSTATRFSCLASRRSRRGDIPAERPLLPAL